MNITARILLWRYRATVADMESLKEIALPALAERRRRINDLATRLRRKGIRVPMSSAEDLRRDIERQLKLGVLQ